MTQQIYRSKCSITAAGSQIAHFIYVVCCHFSTIVVVCFSMTSVVRLATNFIICQENIVTRLFLQCGFILTPTPRLRGHPREPVKSNVYRCRSEILNKMSNKMNNKVTANCKHWPFNGSHDQSTCKSQHCCEVLVRNNMLGSCACLLLYILSAVSAWYTELTSSSWVYADVLHPHYGTVERLMSTELK